MEPVLAPPSSWGLSVPLALSCDRRFIVNRGRIARASGVYQGELRLRGPAGEQVFALDFDATGTVQSDTLTAEQLDAVAAAETLEIKFNIHAEPGEFVTTRTTLAGLAEALPQLTCPEIPGRPLAGGGRDLRGGGEWTAGPGNLPGQDVFYIATFRANGSPVLNVACDGVPSFLMGDFTRPASGGYAELQLEVDGDPAKRVVSDFGSPRSVAPMGSEGRWIRDHILTGDALRVTNLQAPEEDYIYPLTGTRAALASVPCP